MTYATYGPRVPVHPDRIGGDRSAQVPMVSYLILHTSEQSGAEDPNDAEDLAGYLTSPGDRPGRNGPYGSSYHAITDTDRILPCVDHYRIAYSAGGGNRYGLHLCMPTTARQTRAEWLDVTSLPYIEQSARSIIDQATAHGLPLQRITSGEMANGARGYADHWAVSQAFKKSTHTDVGTDFPWDALEDRISQLISPPPKVDTMEFLFRHPLYADVFAVVGGSAIHMTPDIIARFIEDLGDPQVVDDREFLVHVCGVAQFNYARLTPMNPDQVW